MSEFIKHIDFEIRKDSNEEYHSHKEYIGASGLKMMKKSPLHFKLQEQKTTEAMEFGTAYHTFVLEPELFEKEYYLFDDSDVCSVLIGEGAKNPRATNVYKEWYGQQLVIAASRKLIDKQTFSKLENMSDIIFRHKFSKSLLTNGEAEMSIYCEITIITGQKIKVKIRPDYKKDSKRAISDLKTCMSASVHDFPRHAAEFDYHIQAALYHDILSEIEGKEMCWDFYFIAQEKSGPYCFNVFESSPQFLAQGRYEWEQLIMLYAWCLENDKWPGSQVFVQNPFGVNELNLPAYSIHEINWFDHKF